MINWVAFVVFIFFFVIIIAFISPSSSLSELDIIAGDEVTDEDGGEDNDL